MKSIINIKNKEIEKLKLYTKELEQEKEELFINFKTTTNILLDRIKELESIKAGPGGQRPVTAKIIENLQIKSYPGNRFNGGNNGIGITVQSVGPKDLNKVNQTNQSNTSNLTNQQVDSNNRCPGCKLIFPPEKFFTHTLDCLR